jgi:hypothetical protein
VVLAVGQAFTLKFDEFHNAYRGAWGRKIRGRTRPKAEGGESPTGAANEPVRVTTEG